MLCVLPLPLALPCSHQESPGRSPGLCAVSSANLVPTVTLAALRRLSLGRSPRQSERPAKLMEGAEPVLPSPQGPTGPCQPPLRPPLRPPCRPPRPASPPAPLQTWAVGGTADVAAPHVPPPSGIGGPQWTSVHTSADRVIPGVPMLLGQGWPGLRQGPPTPSSRGHKHPHRQHTPRLREGQPAGLR